MSHFTHIKTYFQNLFYLEKALKRLNIKYHKESGNSSDLFNVNLVIPQSNDYDIKFIYNQQEYELVADMSFWEQPYPVEIFIDKIAQQYAGEVIITESNRIGFQVTKYLENVDGSNILILERWNNKKYQ